MPQADTSLHPDTLAIEGGLFTAEWLAKVAAQQAPAQLDADYGVRAGFTLREEIALAWRSAQALWSQFGTARQRPGHDAWAVTQRFATELLRQCLGFHLAQHAAPWVLAERHYPVPYSAAGGRVPIVVSPHDEARPLDTAHERLGDRSGERLRRRSAFGLLQESLNARPDALWGLATNGLLLRIARDNASLTRPAWIEVDLERLFTEQRLADFGVLWLLMHASRFGSDTAAASDCPLEQWRNACREQGVSAREKLRYGVEAALLALGQGFASHPANGALREALAGGSLSPQDYYRELLRLVYRCIFLLTVEERGILHPPGADADAIALYAEGYGLKRLRDRAVRRSVHDRHADLWQGLRQVWQGLATGQPLLALPALGGLFEPSQCPHLDAARIENRDLLQALFHLAWMRDGADAPLTRVNWRDMGPEELGSIYESLLELVPRLSDGHRSFGFHAGAETRGNARKTSGSYYTPDALVQQLLDSALEPVIADKLAAHPAGDGAVRALLSISVIDPACGSGHFLLAAARRIAAHLARIKAQMRDAAGGAALGGGQPTPDDYRHALREVVTHCVYGVDLNPMALELARMALWLEAYTPDAPLGFVDHHFRLGNALLGVMDLKTLFDGIPDEAYKPLTGDDRERCSALKKFNKAERTALGRLVAGPRGLDLQPDFTRLAQPLLEVEALPDDTLAAVQAKRQRYQALSSGLQGQLTQHDRLKTACDLYLAAFMVKKTPAQPVPTTQDLANALLGQPVAQDKLLAAADVADGTPLLHWPLAFAPAFAGGGFSVVLGNPPWERIKLQEEEFFASRAPAVAAARNKAERERAIAALAAQPAGTPERLVHEAFVRAKQQAEAASVFCHGPRYPLTGVGDVNTYALFAETALQLMHARGRAGLVLPSGIATDDSTSAFFGHVSNGRLAQLIDFENRDAIFPGVHRSYKFCLLTLGAAREVRFAFFLTGTNQLADPRRSFTLSADDIARLNPNTRTCPVFRSQADAEITKKIYQRVPVLWDENHADGNPWDVAFRRAFDMAKREVIDSCLSYKSAGYLPMYEAKMIHQFEHRWARYDIDAANTRDLTDQERVDTRNTTVPRYWINAANVNAKLADRKWNRSWLIAFRDICRSTDERTVIAAVLPKAGTDFTLRVLYAPFIKVGQISTLLANLNSLLLDYSARQKIGSTHLADFITKQLPVLAPNNYSSSAVAFIVPRVLELTYTAHDIQPFYADVVAENPSWDPRTGPDRGQPWRWNPERRAILRAELDAIYARLYGLTRDELRYILDPQDVMGADYPSETFRVLKDKEIRQFGEYRTRRLVLEAWDRFATAADTQPRLEAA